MDEWFRAGDIPTGDTDGLPDNHVITIRDRRIYIENATLVQNNVATDTYTLDLDSEWDGISPVVIFGPCPGYESLYQNGPTTIPAAAMRTAGPLDVSVMGYDSTGKVRLVTIEALGIMNVVDSGCYSGVTPDEPDTLLGQIVAAGNAANEAAGTASSAAKAANDAASKANTASESASKAASSASDSAQAATNATDAANTAAQAANEAAEEARNAAEMVTTDKDFYFDYDTVGDISYLTLVDESED